MPAQDWAIGCGMLFEREEFPDFARGWAFRRSYLIANNRRIAPDALRALRIGADDLLVQFNLCEHLDVFAPLACHKVFFFNLSHLMTHYGFGPDGQPLRPCDEGAAASLRFIFPYVIAPPAQAYVERNRDRIDIGVYDPDLCGIRLGVPAGRHPSAGFAMAHLLHALNLGRLARGEAPAPMVCVGFDLEQVRASTSHDFAFEHATIRSWPETVFFA